MRTAAREDSAPVVIETRNLGHRFYDGRWGIQNISLNIHAGTFAVVAGANGSGKTTFFKHLNGLLTPCSGSVTVDGVDVAKDPVRARRLVGLVFQDADAQIVGETVAEDVAFGPENLGLSRMEIRSRVNEALTVMGLLHLSDRRPHELSGGEKRRLAIAGILAMRPKVVILDEPFSNLDWPSARHLLGRILELHESGRTVLVSTHDIEKILAHAERLIIMEKGRIVLDGAPEGLVSQTEAYGIRMPCSVRMGKGIRPWLA